MVENKTYQLVEMCHGTQKVRLGDCNYKVQEKYGVYYIVVSDERAQRWCDRFPSIYKLINPSDIKKPAGKVDDTPTIDPYFGMKYQNLIGAARNKGIKLERAMRKDKLIKALKEHDANLKLPKGTSTVNNQGSGVR